MKFFFRKFSLIPLCVVVFVLAAYFGGQLVDHFFSRPRSGMIFGVSFNPEYARYLQLDAGKVFTTILDEWHFRYVRLVAQWDRVEPQRGMFDFKELDYLMAEAAKRQVKAILTVGQKTPRWPECHFPDWAARLPHTEYRSALKKYFTTVVDRYKTNPAIEMWQVENEPFLPFGNCPSFSQDDLSEELALVHQVDPNHPRLVTDSGELSTWRTTANAADFFGTTMYRVVWNKYVGYFSYDWLPAAFYRLKLALVGRNANTAFISELQAEPWIPDDQSGRLPVPEHNESMSLFRLQKNINYASRVGLPRAYLWGAEWWYWLKEKGHNDIPEYIKNLKKN